MVMDQTSVEFKKVDVSSTFIENIFWSGLTLLSSNDVITIKINKKKIVKNQKKKTNQKDYLKKKLGCQMDKRETNSDFEMKKR